MSFTTVSFFVIFLPLTILLYYKWAQQPHQKTFVLLFFSLLFYAASGWQFIPILISLSIITYWSGEKKWYLPGIGLNLLGLAIFKYLNFGIENINHIINLAGWQPILPLAQLGAPLGISFFVFKHIGYLLDIQNNRYPASKDLLAFLTFSSFFPQITAGPLSSYRDTSNQLSQLETNISPERAEESLVYIAYGLAKKILIADQIATLLHSSTNTTDGFSGFLPALLLLLAYSARLYFDFSGYTDIALGVSNLLGIRLPQNFNSPYLARNVSDFWERWHISLSAWFRQYLFSPLSRNLLKRWGSANREMAQYTANIITMSLVGLWHGASWGFILWGFYHGILLNINAAWKRTNSSLPTWVSRPLFLISIFIGWALFMSPNLAYLQHLTASLTLQKGWGDIASVLQWESSATQALLLALPLMFSGFSETANLLQKKPQQQKWQIIFWGILAALAIFFIQQQIDFVYAQF